MKTFDESREFYQEELIEYCNKCNKEQRETIHVCPYKVSKHNDEESLCNCCDSCYRNCLGDI